MRSSLPTVPTDQNIKSVDLAELAEIAKIVGGWQALADYATAMRHIKLAIALFLTL